MTRVRLGAGMLCAVAVLAAAACTSNDDETSTTTSAAAPPKAYELGSGVTVDIAIPHGWTVRGEQAGESALLTPDGDQRSLTELNVAGTEILGGGDGDDVRMAMLTTVPCAVVEWAAQATKAADGWSIGNIGKDDAHGNLNQRVGAVRELDGGLCLVAQGIDAVHGKDQPADSGVALVQRISKGEIVTAVRSGGTTSTPSSTGQADQSRQESSPSTTSTSVPSR